MPKQRILSKFASYEQLQHTASHRKSKMCVGQNNIICVCENILIDFTHAPISGGKSVRRLTFEFSLKPADERVIIVTIIMLCVVKSCRGRKCCILSYYIQQFDVYTARRE